MQHERQFVYGVAVHGYGAVVAELALGADETLDGGAEAGTLIERGG